MTDVAANGKQLTLSAKNIHNHIAELQTITIICFFLFLWFLLNFYSFACDNMILLIVTLRKIL